MSKDPQKQFGLLDAINVILKKKTFIIVNVFIVTAIAVAVAFMLPKKYTSNATLLPPQNSDPFSVLASGGSSLLSRFGSISSLGVMNEEMYKYIAILQSRALLGPLVNKFDLQQLYDVDHVDFAIETLIENIEYTANEEGTLSIFVTDTDPERVTAMTKHLLHVLDSVNIELSTREARSSRVFIESRIEQNIQDLTKAEEDLQAFQEKYGTIPVSAEVTQSADAMATLYAEKMLKEFEVSYLSESLGENNPQLESATMQLAAITNRLKTFPEMGVQSFRLLREFMVQQKIYELMAPLLEHAKIMENKNTPTIIVLDEPTIPAMPSSPKKKLIVTAFFLFSLFMSIIIVLASEWMRQLNTEGSEEYRIIQEIRKNMRFRKSKT